ncbi:MAG: hypothetical protein LUQ37_00050 [Methanoregulaceae archaeon]|nr:hypothetical protein [Methanoregulaceae archaeon]
MTSAFSVECCTRNQGTWNFSPCSADLAGVDPGALPQSHTLLPPRDPT